MEGSSRLDQTQRRPPQHQHTKHRPHPQSVNHASASGERLHLGSSGLARRRSTRTQSRPMDSHTLEYDTGVSVRSEREGGGLCFLKGNGKGKGSVVEATRVPDAAKIYHWHRDAHWLAAKQSGGLSAQKPANASWVCARVASLAKHFQLYRALAATPLINRADGWK